MNKFYKKEWNKRKVIYGDDRIIQEYLFIPIALYFDKFYLKTSISCLVLLLDSECGFTHINLMRREAK